MKPNELRRLSRRDLLREARAKGLDVSDSASRDELLSLFEDAENRQSLRQVKNRTWTPDRVSFMQGHPDWTAALIAQEMGTTVGAVEYARKRYGRFAPADASGLCVVCDERPVFEASREAERLRLCKGCWLKERQQRIDEERESARLRQAAKRARGAGGEA